MDKVRTIVPDCNYQNPPEPIEVLYGLTHAVARFVLRAIFNMKVEGASQVPRDGPLIIAPTHRSYVDPVFVGAAVPRSAYYMTKAEVFDVPILRTIVCAHHGFPVRRETGDRRAWRIAVGLLRRGRALVIFPEGTRNPDWQLREPKLGVALLALRTGAPVLPVAIVGTERVMPPGQPWLRPAPVRVRIGDLMSFNPILHGPIPRDMLIEIANGIMRTLSMLSGRPYRALQMDTLGK
ncbi:MAG TPA: 1-acyl-sn-glycerol-3-phosphate acyltransferase [Armatimonadetes bacterium]|nr:1-acyl-sn-glycerol-3-phosphate acyltransferase [Armatimonadota bacterium]